MMLIEEPCIRDLHEITRIEDIEPLDDAEERGGPAPPTANKGEEISKGSINDMIRKQTKEEQKQNTAQKYNLFVDFDTCEPYEGQFKAQHRVDINKFGKSIDKEVNKWEINNTQATN
jgi:hypothetical protein